MTQDTKAQESRYRSTGIPGAAPLVPVDAAPVGLARRAGRAFMSWLKTASVTLGVMYMIAWFAVTLTVVGLNSRFGRYGSFENTRQKSVIAEAARPYALPPDLTITAAAAGRAYAAMLPPENSSPAFPMLAPDHKAEAPWRDANLMQPGLFEGMRTGGWNGPNSTEIIALAAKGLGPKELSVLRTIAMAPVWRDFDIVARAPAVDINGARFVLPFSEAARAPMVPIIKFSATKEMAYAGVSRAAYYVAIGQRAEAEKVLREIISYGLVLKDNSSFLIEELISDVVVGIGRAALVDFYAVTNDPRGAALGAAHERAVSGAIAPAGPAWVAGGPGRNSAARARLMEIIASPDASRALRFEALNALSYSTCGNLREFVGGPGRDVRAAFDEARRSLARHPSDQDLINLIERTVPAGMPDGAVYNIDARVVGVTQVAERFFLNPRLTTCVIRGLGGF